MAEMDKVNVKFNADVTKFTRAVDRMERKMRDFDDKTTTTEKNVNKRFDMMNTSVSKIDKSMAEMGDDVDLSNVKLELNSAKKEFKDTGSVSQKTFNNLQKSISNVDTSKMTSKTSKAFNTLSKDVGKLDTQLTEIDKINFGKSLGDEFKTVGYSFKDLQTKLNSTELSLNSMKKKMNASDFKAYSKSMHEINSTLHQAEKEFKQFGNISYETTQKLNKNIKSISFSQLPGKAKIAFNSIRNEMSSLNKDIVFMNDKFGKTTRIVNSVGGSVKRTFGGMRNDFSKTFKTINKIGTTLRNVGEVASGMFKGLMISSFTAIIPVAGAVVSSVMAIGSSLTAVVGGAVGLGGAFGIAGAGAMTMVGMSKRALAMLDEGLLKATAETRKYQSALSGIKSQFDNLVRGNQAQIFNVMANGINVARFALTQLTPAINKVASITSNASNKLLDWVKNSKNAQNMFSILNRIGPQVFKNILNAIGSFGDGAVALFNKLNPLFTWASQGFENMARSFQKWANSTSTANGVKDFINYTKTNLPILGSIFGNVFNGIINLFKAFSSETGWVLNGLDSMTNKFKNWSATLSQNKSFQNFLSYIRQNAPMVGQLIGNIVDVFVQFVKAVSPIGSVVLSIAVKITQMMSSFMQAHPQITKFIASAVALSGVIKFIGIGIGIVLPIIRRLGMVLKILPPIMKAVGLAIRFMGGPVTIIIGIITTLVGVFVHLWKTNEGFRNAVIGIWNSIKYWATTIFTGIKNFLLNVWTNIKNGVVLIVQIWWQIVKGYFQLWKTVIMAIFNGIKNFFVWIWNVIKTQVVAKIVQMYNQVKTWFNQLWFSIKSIFTTVRNWLFAVWLAIYSKVSYYARLIWTKVKQYFTYLWNSVRTIFTTVKNWLVNTWNFIYGKISSFARWIWTKVKQYFTWLWNSLKSIITAVKNWLISTWSYIYNKISSFARWIWTKVKQYFTWLWNSTKSIFTSVKNWLISTWNYIYNKISNFARYIWTKVKQYFTWLWNSVKSIVTTVKNWLVSTWNYISNKVVSFARYIWTRVKSAFTSLWRSIKSIFTTVKNWLISTWNYISDKVVSFARYLWDKVQSAFMSLWRSTKSIFNSVRSFLYDVWRKIRDFVVKYALKLYNGVKDNFTNLWNSTKRIFNNVWDFMVDVWNNIKNSVVDTAKDLWDRVESTFNNMKNGLSKIIDKIKGFIGDMVDSIKSGLNKLIDGINWVGDKLGIDKEIPHLSTGTTHNQQVNRKVKTSSDGALKEGTFATVGDKGKGNGPGGFRNEMIKYPNGKISFTPNRDTNTFLPKGSKVYSGKQTHALLNQKPTNSTLGGDVNPHLNGGTVGNALSWAGDKLGQGYNWTKDKVGKGANWLKDKVGDVMDWVEKPGKLLDKALEAFGVDFGDYSGIVGDFARGGLKRLKKGAEEKIKGWFAQVTAGNSSFLDFSPGNINFPYSPNGRAPGYPFNSPHMGIDLNYIYEKVYSTISGLARAIPQDGSGFGNHVSIKNGSGLEVIYGHLSDFAFDGSKQVKAGDKLGTSGNSGRSSGPHLHYEMRQDGKPFNPLPWLKSHVGGSGGNWNIKKALKKAGLPTSKDYVSAWQRQIQTESGGDAKAIGGTDGLLDGRAKGLVQVKPGTFNAFKLPGHDNIMNGMDNLIAGMRYASAKYGSSILDVIGHGHGYASGGIINSPEMAWLAEGGFSESVISHDPANKVKSQAIWKETGDKLGFSTEGETLRRIMELIEEGNETNETIEVNTRNSGNNPIYLDNKKVGKQVAEPVKQEIENIERRNKRFNRR